MRPLLPASFFSREHFPRITVWSTFLIVRGCEVSVVLQSLGRGGESGLVVGLDFKSSGVRRKPGSVGSIPMHLRQFDLRPFNGSGIKIRFISIDER